MWMATFKLQIHKGHSIHFVCIYSYVDSTLEYSGKFCISIAGKDNINIDMYKYLYKSIRMPFTDLHTASVTVIYTMCDSFLFPLKEKACTDTYKYLLEHEISGLVKSYFVLKRRYFLMLI
jgi:hypothetical protein